MLVLIGMIKSRRDFFSFVIEHIGVYPALSYYHINKRTTNLKNDQKLFSECCVGCSEYHRGKCKFLKCLTHQYSDRRRPRWNIAVDGSFVRHRSLKSQPSLSGICRFTRLWITSKFGKLLVQNSNLENKKHQDCHTANIGLYMSSIDSYERYKKNEFNLDFFL
jgi:hypothetical protein